MSFCKLDRIYCRKLWLIVTFIYPLSDVIIGGGKIRMVFQGNLLSKTSVIGILILLVGMSVVPSISGNISESNIISNECRRINKMIFNGRP